MTKTEKSVPTPNAGNDIVKPADKTVVSDPNALTPEEKKVIEDKVKAVNPGSTVVVTNNGTTTVTTPSGKTAVIPGVDLTKTEEGTTKPNAGNDIVTPVDKTVVSNPDALTPEEKKVIEDKVKAVNPGSTVVVDDKGNATVTTPSGKTAVIPGADLTKTEEDVTKQITAPSESESTLASTSADTLSSETPSAGKSRQQLPNTGTEASKSSVLLGALAAVTGLGLFAKRRKRDDEE